MDTIMSFCVLETKILFSTLPVTDLLFIHNRIFLMNCFRSASEREDFYARISITTLDKCVIDK